MEMLRSLKTIKISQIERERWREFGLHLLAVLSTASILTYSPKVEPY